MSERLQTSTRVMPSVTKDPLCATALMATTATLLSQMDVKVREHTIKLMICVAYFAARSLFIYLCYLSRH